MKTVRVRKYIRTTPEKLATNLKATYQQIKKAIDWQWFGNLWENNANVYEFYELARDTMKKLGKEISFSQFETGWQYRLVLDKNYENAKKEFINLLLGWY